MDNLQLGEEKDLTFEKETQFFFWNIITTQQYDAGTKRSNRFLLQRNRGEENLITCPPTVLSTHDEWCVLVSGVF